MVSGNVARLLGIGKTGLSSRFSGGSLVKGNVCSWKVTSREVKHFLLSRS
jgi:hypothetical protein